MNNQNTTVLVTGGSGFLGSHTILQLLEKGYRVKTTVRSLDKKNIVIDLLKNAGVKTFEHLTFVEADLNSDKNWDEAVKGCTYVLHVASPFPMSQPEDENELIIPAREGALRVLHASRDAGVKRVVLTSSFAAVGYSKSRENHTFTEEDWTDPNANVTPYVKSKMLAERAAWDFIEKEGNGMELAVINPTGIFGPVLGANFGTSVKMALGLATGQYLPEEDFSIGAVDVRDVADLHIKAMTHPEAKGQRFIATSESTTVNEMIDLLHLDVVKRPAGNPVMVSISNEKARKVLGWNPRGKVEAIKSTIDSALKTMANQS